MAKKTASQSKKDSEIQKKYQKIDQHAHVLTRPGMYIGRIKSMSAPMLIHDRTSKDGMPELIIKDINYVPGLYKIFDEILVNARDHVIRTSEDPNLAKCTVIRIDIDKSSGKICVKNNGAGVPVVMHEKEKIMIPSMIFGQLLTSENFDDNVDRKVGGTNGLGAKLANIYSSVFEIETVDSNSKKKFYQKFSNNMYDKTEPKVTSASKTKPYTQFTFIPDLEKFGIKKLSSDIISLFRKRAYDIAATCSAKVYYNGEIINVNTFPKYIDSCFPRDSEFVKIVDSSNPEWQVGVVYDPNDKLSQKYISFVNGISTIKGGTHVDYVVNKIVKKIHENVSKKAKDLVFRPATIKENLIFFISAIIVNPEFDNQTKDSLTTKSTEFGTSYTPPDTFLNKIMKSGVVNQIILNARAKADAKLASTAKGKNTCIRDYPKLYDASHAYRKRGDCHLILTEGDSAKTFAVSGLTVIGREKYGVFPLKGKIINVVKSSADKVANNEEIRAIIKIVGLMYNTEYTSTKGLRYGKILILTDQDTDGFHIKGLFINFIKHFWPSLAKMEGFIEYLATPLIRATKKGSGKKNKVLSFYSPPEYSEWLQKTNNGAGYTMKYYKGLGTNTAADAAECFTDIDKKVVSFYWRKFVPDEKNESSSIEEVTEESDNSDEPVEKTTAIESYTPKFKDVCEEAISMAFGNGRENDRKVWIKNYIPGRYIDPKERRVPYDEFVNKELIEFSIDDVARSIPNIMDGFKPGQRKVYYGSIKRKLNSSIKVAQLAGYISEHMEYHHGEASLHGTIINMAQSYVGSNNINVLYPDGQFGTRLAGGNDHASPRYIFTKLLKLGEKIFIKLDEPILDYLIEDGRKIEPKYMLPIIPMILVNGSNGIGTGFSTSIPQYNPLDIISNIKRVLSGKRIRKMNHWYRNFTGTIEKLSEGRYVSNGSYSVDKDTLTITELPIGVWTENYKAFLGKLADETATKPKETSTRGRGSSRGRGRGRGRGGKSNVSKFDASKSGTAKVAKSNTIGQDIKTYVDHCTDIIVHFTVKFHPGKLREHVENGTLVKNMKLQKKIGTTNMHLFDDSMRIRMYETAEDILDAFIPVRLDYYQKRKDYLLGDWSAKINILKWKLAFIRAVISEEIIVFKKKKAQIVARLEELKYPKLSEKYNHDADNSSDPDNDSDNTDASYNYLTSMSIIRFSKEELNKLEKMVADKKKEIKLLKSKTPSDIWLEELDELERGYIEWDKKITLAHKKALPVTRK